MEKVIVVGAGVGGLAASIELARSGFEVTLLERASAPGGKMRRVAVGGALLDGGPTVFTMRWVLDEIFGRAGTSLDAWLTLRPAATLARHAWDEGGTLDLFADIACSADAIGTLAGAAEARGFLAFCEQARRIYATLEEPFIRGQRPTLLSLVRDTGVSDMFGILPFATLWKALGTYFADPRLRQLFGRYATYCGSSPFAAPATLMLVAHVEQEGVWLVDGGMHEVALAMAALATRLGASVRTNAEVKEIVVSGGQARGVLLASGERIEADAIVLNADCAAVASGLFGRAASKATPPIAPATRSLSAVTWAMHARTSGFGLRRHNVFFSRAYRAEFDEIFDRRRLPTAPTVYVCAQDRGDGDSAHGGPERLLCLVNAPPDGDTSQLTPGVLHACTQATFGLLERCGLHVDRTTAAEAVTTPAQFNALFPATGGALYGQAVHGSMATFKRPGSRTKLPGLYLAGGSAHPGAGVPMAALSGCRAAESLRQDLASTGRSLRAATNGGMSMRSATTAPTG
jgi:1-hydroxycarotenoid 3,4-desaturase